MRETLPVCLSNRKIKTVNSGQECMAAIRHRCCRSICQSSARRPAYASIFMIGSTQPTPVVAEPPAGTPAAMAGLHAGDKILKVGDSEIKTFTDLRMEMLNKFGSTTDILVHSPNGSEVTKEIDLTKMSLDPKAKDADPFDESVFI